MNDHELRQIVRQAIARQLSVQSPASNVPGPSSSSVRTSAPSYVPESVPFGDHASHAMYLQLVNTTTACVIEEHVSCDHCGYCKSHGH
jgi:hypothetical protein